MTLLLQLLAGFVFFATFGQPSLGLYGGLGLLIFPEIK